MNEIVLIIGVQGSGKSTVVKPLVDKGYVRFNRDTLGGSMTDILGKVLATGGNSSIVMDNTFCTIADRKPFIDAAKKLGMTCRAMVMGTSFEDAQFNVCQRIVRKYGRLLTDAERKTSKDPEVIPPVAMFTYRKNYQFPTRAEGFDDIQLVPFTRKYDHRTYAVKAVILDKDGTLTRCKSGAKYPCTADDVELLPGRREKIAEMVEQGYLILGVSNQSGVAKGELTIRELEKIFSRTNQLVQHLIDWSYCPHRVPPISCFCRKPGSGMGVEMIEKYKLNPAECIMVGDMTTDETFAKRCGFKYIPASKFFKVQA